MSQTKQYPTFKNLTDDDIEGLVKCYCGCKYWENLVCIDCGEKVTPELYLQLVDFFANKAFEPIR